MTADGFYVEPPAIRAGGDGIVATAGQLRERLASFQQELAGYGEPWGTDDLGTLIGTCYQAIADLAMEVYQDNLDELDAYGEDVGAMADTYEQAEQATEDSVRTITDRLG